MARRIYATFGAALGAVFIASTALAAPVLGTRDFIIPIDTDPPAELDISEEASRYPDPGERPALAFDGSTTTKYLNFGEQHSGVILNLGEPTTIKSMLLTTANDAVERDPTQWSVWGTNEEILTPDLNQGDTLEAWTLISEGSVALPATRFAAGPVLSFAANNIAYNAYRIVFPNVKDRVAANSMQISEIGLYPTANATGPTITAGADPNVLDARAIDLEQVQETIVTFNSRSPGGEQAPLSIDNNQGTKYLNFGEENSGFIVTPANGPTTVTSLRIRTANDAQARDPLSYAIYGTNDAITSTAHSVGDGENWTLISQGDLALPTERFTISEPVEFTNTTAYASYRVIFPTVSDAAAANSMQIADIQLYDGAPIVASGDFDFDSDADGADFMTWQRNQGEGDVPLPFQLSKSNGDANLDQVIDGADLTVWKGKFGQTPAGSPVPEPFSAALALAGAVAAVAVGRRQLAARS